MAAGPLLFCAKLPTVPTANCSLLVVLCLWLIVRPTPPCLSMFICLWHSSTSKSSFLIVFSRFKNSNVPRKEKIMVPLSWLNVWCILLAWSADHVSWKQTLTHTRRPLRANVLFILRTAISRVKRCLLPAFSQMCSLLSLVSLFPSFLLWSWYWLNWTFKLWTCMFWWFFFCSSATVQKCLLPLVNRLLQ